MRTTKWFSSTISPTFNGFYDALTDQDERLDVAFRNGKWLEAKTKRLLVPSVDFVQWRGRDVSIAPRAQNTMEARVVVDRGASDALRLYRHFACNRNVEKATYYFLVAQRLQAKFKKSDGRIYKLTISGMENSTGLRIRKNVDKMFPPIPI